MKRGEVKQQGDIYHAATEALDALVPIGMRMRTTQGKKVKFDETAVTEDLDDEIERLERELENDDAGGSSDEDDSEAEDSAETNNAQETAVLSLSQFANDRVVQLPSTLLPEPGRYSTNKVRKSKSKKTKNEPDPSAIVQSGLHQAVQEVLDGYTARSAEKLPFFCRFCAKQYSNETEFFDHKNTDFHKTAVAMERKATYCRLCRRQLTSPTQMKEHLKSRPHKDKLQEMRSRQAPLVSRRQFA